MNHRIHYSLSVILQLLNIYFIANSDINAIKIRKTVINKLDIN